MTESRETEVRYSFEVYPKRDLTLVRGQGATVWDDQGRTYIDCTSGIGVANVGHCNPEVAAAVAHQAGQLITCPGIFYNDVRARAMASLVRIAPDPLSRVFLSNSGTEAMEAAIKFARWTTGRAGVVSAMRGFHGRSLGALSATFRYRDEFEPLIPGHRFVPFNQIARLEAALDDDIAAVLLEPVQGEGGVRPAHPEYLQSVRQLCDARGILLIFDEVQTGFGRTGHMFASQTYGVTPDILCLAKGIAGGVPMGATLVNERIAAAVGKHGSTFGGNPLACAAAIASIDQIETQDLPGRALRLGAIFADRFRTRMPPVVRDFRHLGLMLGIELKTRSRPYLEALMQAGVLALPAGPTVIRLLPPLVILEEDLVRACDLLVAVLEQPITD